MRHETSEADGVYRAAPCVQLMVIAVLTVVDGVYKDAAKDDKDTAQLTVRRVRCGVTYCASVHVTY